MNLQQDWILQNIRRLRIEKGIKVENLAKDLGISIGEYSKLKAVNEKNI